MTLPTCRREWGVGWEGEAGRVGRGKRGIIDWHVKLIKIFLNKKTKTKTNKKNSDIVSLSGVSSMSLMSINSFFSLTQPLKL